MAAVHESGDRSRNVFDHVMEMIGNTPMLRLGRMPVPDGVSLYAKLEWANPGGSVKDRIGLALILTAEEQGLLKPGGTIIEPTAGNTGIGLALAAIGRPYRVMFVVPEQFSVEKQQLMAALGAELVRTPSAAGMEGAIARAQELAADIPGAFVPQQFANPANPQAHYETTGPEIWEQMEGRVDMLVAGVGTGGTFTGATRYLKEKNPDLRAVAVEPEGSVLGGGPKGPHRTEGIGVEFIPKTLDTDLIDAVCTVTDDHAFQTAAQLARREGLLAGSSSAAACWAALREAETAPAGTRIAVIFPDAADRYLSKGIFAGEISGA